MTGLVMRSTGSWYDVLLENGERIACRIRGKIRLEGIKETNPVAVGDRVDVLLENQEGVITAILPRDNIIVRQSVKKTAHGHVIAANLDQALLVATLQQPRTSLGFIDRFLAAAESFRIPQALVFNKRDLLNADALQQQAELVALYQRLGVTCLVVSAQHDDLQPLRDLLHHKITLIAGHSGVGKSTLINKLSPAINQKTSAISDFSSKGTHTTTFAEMFQLEPETFIIDTPGIKEFGLMDMSPEEISDYFVEMRALRPSCKFGARCLHLHEPRCAVKEAVENHTVALSRYESYVSMVMGGDNRK